MFLDNGSGGGHLTVNGVAQAAQAWITVNAVDLGSVSYVGGSAAGSETLFVAASDGKDWSANATLTATTLAPPPVNHAPVVTTHDVSVAANGAVPMSSLFAAHDQEGDGTITQYMFLDNGSGGGHLTLNGVALAAQTWITVNAADLGSVSYVGGSAAGSETLFVAASDGKAWSANATLTATTLAPVTAPSRPARGDFNGDGTSDILFRNNANGATWVAEMDQGSLANWSSLGSSSTSYRAVGVGDFNGDGTSDVLVRNAANGDTWSAEVSDGNFAGWHQIGSSNTAFSVVGVGDFYGSGTSDFLVRNNATGSTWFGEMSGGDFAGWHQVGNSNTAYSVVGVGDFNGDATDDILFRNNANGDTWFAQMNDGALQGWHQVGGSNTAFSVAGVGDFNGDGTDDILFRNNATGDNWFAQMNDGAFQGWHQIGGSNTAYAVAAVGDYNGNGTSDILFRNNGSGDTWFAAMNNGALDGWHQVATTDPSYSVIRT
jgi:hypothetical protein